MNKVLLVGRVGTDPLTKSAKGGRFLCTFNVATNDKDKTDWHRVVAWDSVATICQSLEKGDPLFVEGKLQTRSWTDNSGNKKFEVEVVAWTVYPLKGREDEVEMSEHRNVG